ncbi:MAG: hypothetical protein IJC04_05335 [Oscillospiraceae bacterium]|nr:hypothetical protein [Oscillospiraceae bacterium]
MKETKPYKASKVILDKKLSLVAYVITLVCAVAARTIQLNTNMDFAMGKYIDPSLAKNYTFWALLIGFAVIFAIMILGKSRDKAIKSCILINPMRLRAERLNKKISPHAGAAMFILALLIVFEIFMDFSAVAKANLAISTEDNPVFIFAGIPAMEWVLFSVKLITIITLISTGVNIMKGEGISSGNCVFMMFFPIWKLIEIFAMFSENQLVGIYSEKIIELFTAMTASMFFLCAARLFGGWEKKNTRFWMCIFGYMASVFAMVSVAPRYIMLFIKSYTERDGMEMPAVSNIGIAVVTIAIIAVFWSTYVYRVMPKLNLTGKRRWTKTTMTSKGMSDITDEV